jgi:hypothetical protein
MMFVTPFLHREIRVLERIRILAPAWAVAKPPPRLARQSMH